MTEPENDYTPALGRHELTDDYDRVIAIMTRERRWRSLMLSALAPQPNETVVDIGAGTGSFALLVKQTCPDARVVAIDPDPAVRRIAERKFASNGVHVDYITAMGNAEDVEMAAASVDKATCSLVLHQCPMEAKKGILANIFHLLKPGGRLLISDYGKQRNLLMHMLFKQVRAIDGYENTKANKDGMIPVLMEEAGFGNVEEMRATPTPTGSISLYSGWKPS